MSARVAFSLELHEAGGAVLEFGVGEHSVRIDPSHILDPMQGLLYSGVVAATRQPETSVSFVDEPGEWRWVLKPVEPPPSVHFRMLRFENFNPRQSESNGKQLFSAACDGKRYGRVLLNAFWPWSKNPEEYQRRWREPFPARAFHALQEAIST
ncbi:MAG TPA: hypothetical protein DHW63_00900 [Hyphomonadaceae bacterium]|nr:hypothetical protein [Hyphomonadaceae bacterium]